MSLFLPLVHHHLLTACSAWAVSSPCHLLSLAAAHSPVSVSSWEVVGNLSDEKSLAGLQLCGIHGMPCSQGCLAYHLPPPLSAAPLSRGKCNWKKKFKAQSSFLLALWAMEEPTTTIALFNDAIVATSFFLSETWLLCLSHHHGCSPACGEAEDSKKEDRGVHPAQIRLTDQSKLRETDGNPEVLMTGFGEDSWARFACSTSVMGTRKQIACCLAASRSSYPQGQGTCATSLTVLRVRTAFQSHCRKSSTAGHQSH